MTNEVFANSPVPGVPEEPVTQLAANGGQISPTTAVFNISPQLPDELQTGGQFHALIDHEFVIIPCQTGTALTGVQRGVEGSTQATHNDGSGIIPLLTAGALENALAAVQAAAETYASGLTTAEATRAEAAEGTNAGAISAEVTRAEGAEGTNAAAISGEVTRAEAAEATKASSSALTAETTRAETAEASDSSATSAEVTRAETAEATKAMTTAVAATAVTGTQTIAAGTMPGWDISGANGVGNLPHAPANGTRVGGKVLKVNSTPGTYTLTINCTGGDTFFSGATSVVLKGLGESKVLEYNGGIWQTVSSDAAIDSPLGAVRAGSDGLVGTPGKGGTQLSGSVGNASSQTIDARTYGAVEDGATDNTTAIQNALNAASTAGGGTVTLPMSTGEGYVAQNLTVPAGVILEGRLMPGYTSPSTVGSILKQTGSSGTAFITLDSNSAIREICLACNNTSDGIAATSYGYEVKHCEITGAINGINCHFFGGLIAENGINSSSACGITNPTDSDIHDNTINANTSHGINCSAGANDNRINGNKIEWNIGCGLNAFEALHLVVTANIFDRNGAAGVHLNTCQTCTVTGNVLRRNGAQSSGVTAGDCHFYDNVNVQCVFSSNTTEAGSNDGGGGYASPVASVVTIGGTNNIWNGNYLGGAEGATPVNQGTLPTGGGWYANSGISELPIPTAPTVVSATNATLAIPAGAGHALVQALGGGGGGGGGGSATTSGGISNQVGGGGGGAGETVTQYVSLAALTTLNVTIGAGGGGGGGGAANDNAGSNGSNGTSTTVAATGIAITAHGGGHGNGSGGNSAATTNGGIAGSSADAGTTQSQNPGNGGYATSTGGLGNVSTIGLATRGGSGGGAATATLGGSGGSAYANVGTGGSGTTSGLTPANAPANSGQGGDGGGGGAPGGAGGSGGNGGSGFVIIWWLP